MKDKEHLTWQYFHPKLWLTWLGFAFWRLAVTLPYPLIIYLGRKLGLLMYFVKGYRYEIAKTNLKLCFPDMPELEQKKLLRDNFISYGIAFFEVGIAWWWSTRRLKNITQLEGLEHIDNLNGKGALLMAIHHTTLEVGASGLCIERQIDGMYRPHKNIVYDYIQRKGRLERSSDSDVYTRDDVRGILKALRKGKIIWYAPDQDYGPKQSVFASYFGVQAASVTATAKFAKVGESAILPFSHIRLPKNHGYKIIVHPPLENFPSNQEIRDAERINRIIENMILQQPDQYLWAHRRFKTRPDGEARPYPQKERK